MESEDRVLRMLMHLADGESMAFGTHVTVFAGATKVTGEVTSRLAYARHIDASLQTGLKNIRAGDKYAEIAAKALEGGMERNAEEQYDRRRELSAVLTALAHPAQREGTEAQKEFDELQRLDVLTLKDATIWGPGFNPVAGPLSVEFFRIPVRSIDGWFLGTPG